MVGVGDACTALQTCSNVALVFIVGGEHTHSKPKNVFLHIFCVRMCEKCVIKCLFGTHGVTNAFHYRKISVIEQIKVLQKRPANTL